MGTDTDIETNPGWGTYGFQGVTVDNVAPTISTAEASSPTEEATLFTLTGIASDGGSGIQSTTWELISNPNGDVMTPVVEGLGNNITNFTPSDNGLYLFRFTAVDNAGNVSVQIVNVTVDNLDPTAVDDVNTANEDGPAIVGNVLTDGVDDSDPAGPVFDPLTVTEVNGVPSDVGMQITLPSGALLQLNSDGTYTYDPNGAFEYLADMESTSDSFQYTISDGDGGTAIATVTINITGTNDAPVLTPVDVTGTIVEGSVLNDTGSLTFADVDQTDTATTGSAPVSATWSAGSLSPTQEAALYAAFSITPASFPGNSGTVDWDYTILVSPGDSITIPVNIDIEPLADVYLTTFQVNYDTAILAFDSADNGAFWTSVDGWSLVVNDTTPGKV